MDNKGRKYYTLYLKFYGKKVEILEGTLKEIDDFTTHFSNSAALAKLLLPNGSINYYSFIIESSKKNEYKVVYNSSRFILFDSNINYIMSKLKELSPSILIDYLVKNTNVIKYNESSNASSIPIVRLYRKLLSKDNYYSELDNCIRNDYKFLRGIASTLLSNIDLSNMCMTIDTQRKNEIAIYLKSIKENIYIIYQSMEGKIHEDEDDDDIYDEPIVESIEERGLDIVGNNDLTLDEKLNELSLLYDDLDEYHRFVMRYVPLVGDRK